MGRVVHVRKDPFDLYIGRGRNSTWGNPFKIGDPHPESGEPIVRGEAIELYKEWIVRGDGATSESWRAPRSAAGARRRAALRSTTPCSATARCS